VDLNFNYAKEASFHPICKYALDVACLLTVKLINFSKSSVTKSFSGCHVVDELTTLLLINR